MLVIRDCDFYKKCFEKNFTPQVVLCINNSLHNAFEDVANSNSLFEEDPDPCDYYHACDSITHEFDRRMRILIKTGKAQGITRSVRQATTNKYPYPEYMLNNQLRFHVKKSNNSQMPAWSSFRENRSEDNQMYLFEEEDIFLHQKSHRNEIPYGIIFYSHSSKQIISIDFGFPRSRREGEGWIGNTYNLISPHNSAIKTELITPENIEFNYEALRLLKKTS